MCNLNILIKNKKHKLEKVVAFLQSVTTISYERNNDADGVFFQNGKLYKSSNKQNYLQHFKDIEASDLIMTHQRISTSGRSEKNHQPFKTKEFALVHNGVLFGKGSVDKSDTKEFFDEFCSVFKKEKGKDRNEKVINAIKTSMEDISGSYSIMIYDRITNKAYYFKNNSTSISIYHTKDESLVYITTNKDNAQFNTLLGEEFEEYDIEPMKIYTLDVNNPILLIEGSLPETITYSYSYPRYNRSSKIYTFNEKNNSFDEKDDVSNNINIVRGKANKPLSAETQEIIDEITDYGIELFMSGYNQPTSECLKYAYDEIDSIIRDNDISFKSKNMAKKFKKKVWRAARKQIMEWTREQELDCENLEQIAKQDFNSNRYDVINNSLYLHNNPICDYIY